MSPNQFLHVDPGPPPPDSQRPRQVLLRCSPREEVTRVQYREQCRRLMHDGQSAPRRFVTLDGYVTDSTYHEDVDGAQIDNYNHHGRNESLDTPSTSRQIFLAIMEEDIDECLTDDTMELNEVDDCDPDVSLAHWLRLRRKDIARWRGGNTEADKARLERITKLVRLEDRVDRKGGFCKMDLNDSLIGEMAWVFEPYFSRRSEMPSMNSQQMEGVIGEICERLDRYAEGQAGSLPLDLRCTEIDAGATDDAAFIDETIDGTTSRPRSGPYAKVRMINADKRLVVTVRKARVPVLSASAPMMDHDGAVSEPPTEERYFYTIVQADGEEVPFEVQPYRYEFGAVFEELNHGLPAGTRGRWDGRRNAGGAPRAEGTKQTPADVARVLRNNRLEVVADEPRDEPELSFP